MVSLHDFLQLLDDQDVGVELCERGKEVTKNLFGKEKRKITQIQKKIPAHQILANSGELLARAVESFDLLPLPKSMVVYLAPKE